MNDQQRAILDFEKRFYATQSGKENDIREQFGMSAVRYYQILTALLDEADALAAEPVLVKRLRRIRDSRAKLRRAG
ncbi:DUF3263 domain-containing protein [Rhodococcus sp. Eu-32]|uniref:DUF3263 domain-containing protein n=1 Tax=Rhodococcus sp. Eu-32 TaxID=1017319 RepID=UPI000DF471C2|nr:DUF3263 domain-containing protein [Rhodococcus sp. Eu-32]RRQ26268.1 DUF3263 domain-containing protein [Rhodococcus sp. Eu-32]